MITRCWEFLHQEDLIHFGVCDCRDECQRKAELVDALMDIMAREGFGFAGRVAVLVQRSMPAFREC